MDDLITEIDPSFKPTHYLFSREQWRQFVHKLRMKMNKLEGQNYDLRNENSALDSALKRLFGGENNLQEVRQALDKVENL